MDDLILVIEDEEAREQIADLDDRIFMLEEEMRVLKTIMLKVVTGVSDG
jgi:hypothetical protein